MANATDTAACYGLQLTDEFGKKFMFGGVPPMTREAARKWARSIRADITHRSFELGHRRASGVRVVPV